MWEKSSKGLLRNPDRLLKNTDKRMIYIYGNIFFAKKDFTFGLQTLKSGEIHFIQTTHVPMLIYELPAFCLKYRAQPNVIRRSFEPYDQMLYHRTILEPHTAYPIPAGTNYIVLTLIQKGLHVRDFRKMKKFDQTPYKLPPPTPVHVLAEKRPLEEKLAAFVQETMRMTPIPESPVQIPESPVQISEPLVAEPPVQISFCPRASADSRTYADSRACADSPRAQHFGADGCTRLAHVVLYFDPRPKNSSCFTSHLDLTWDKGVDLKFLSWSFGPVSPSGKTLEGVSASKYGGLHFDLSHCTRLAVVYVSLVDVTGRLRNASRREPIWFGVWCVSTLG
ncbi:uncharacterized protein TNCV_3196641 [Trichonephila clavipes]|nr:uncharacterized protein TNCV_3196641 [Trichonephila clavipes]